MAYTLQLLHASDLEGGVEALENAPYFAAIVDALEDLIPNTLVLSAGDNYIPGPFYNAAADQAAFRDSGLLNVTYNEVFGLPGGGVDSAYGGLRETEGRVDVSIMNVIGFDASAVGNHEFDPGTAAFGGLLAPDYREAGTLEDDRWVGTQFPYLSANLDFSGDSNLAGLYTDEILLSTDFETGPEEAIAGTTAPKIAPATIIDVNGESIGVVGATTQLVESISSTGGVEVVGPNADDMPALAAILQPVIDEIIGMGVNKVILVSHLQQISLEKELAQLLHGVDIIVAGGSDTLLADDEDTLHPGDTAAGDYPFETTDADGNPVLIVSTAGEYSYVGRLVVTFDDDGVLDLTSVDADVSGAFASTEETVEALYGDLDTAFADGTKGDLVRDLTEAVEEVVIEQDGNILGYSDVFLEGRREEVRTEETNFGNLSADANLAAAQQFDPTVLVSIKNGGGIRAAIGAVDGETGDLLPNEANPASGKEEGEVSQLDVVNTLRFNNTLTLQTLTAEQLLAVVEHGVAASGDGATPGQFPQIGGMHFSYDADLPAGERVVSLAIKDAEGNTLDVIVANGEIVGDADRPIRVVTLNFLAAGGDNYPFDEFAAADPDFADVVQLADELTDPGAATFAAPGSEQDALAEYLIATTSPDAPYDTADTDQGRDARIQNLDERSDTVNSPVPTGEIELEAIGRFEGGAAEIVTYDAESRRMFVTNSGDDAVDIVDLSDPANPAPIAQIDLTVLPGYGSLTSVAAKNGLLAVAIVHEDEDTDGFVALFDMDGNLLNQVTVGNLPDNVVFTGDGMTLLTANEGEPRAGDPLGSISIIDVSGGAAAATVETLDFTAFDAQQEALQEAGVRFFPGETLSTDVEPEYVAISPDGSTAFVTLQEANAVAVVDIATKTITEILPLGLKDHSAAGNGLDASDRDGGIDIQNHPVFGMYMPDTIASFEIDGQTYFAIANEGDDRGENERLEDVDLDPTAFPDADELQSDEQAGRISVSPFDGDTDGDGDIDVIHTYGARSFSIFDADGNLVFDSGDQFERITAEMVPQLFNSDESDPGEFDTRSDAKGPEPEALTVGKIDGETYVFVGLERTGGIMVYNVSDPAAARFVQYINTAPHDIAPEGMTFVSADDSPNGAPLLLVANEVSGTTAIFQVTLDPEDPVTGSAGDDLIVGTENSDVIDGAAGDDILLGGAGLEDRLTGSSGDDIIVGGNGRDVATFAGDLADYRIEFMSARDVSLYNRLLPDDGKLDPGAPAFRVEGPDGFDVVQADAFAFDDRTVEVRGGALVFGDGDDEVNGGRRDDFLVGGGGDDELAGDVGDDILVGNGGGDLLDGQSGDDILVADSGEDALLGASGDDLLIGATGAGEEVFMVGGSGADTFMLAPAGDALDIQAVIEFVQGDDRINLAALRDGLGSQLDFADIQAVLSDVGGNAVIDLSGFVGMAGESVDGTLTLLAFDPTDLGAGDFEFESLPDLPPGLDELLTPSAATV